MYSDFILTSNVQTYSGCETTYILIFLCNPNTCRNNCILVKLVVPIMVVLTFSRAEALVCEQPL